MKVKFFNPGLEFKNNQAEYTKAWTKVRLAGDLILREGVEALEKAFAKYVGTKYAVGLNSGTDALFIALKAHGIGKGDEVMVPSHTFVATAQVVVQAGAKPILYDMNHPTTVSKRVKAVIVAHIAGEIKPDMKFLVKGAKNVGHVVIEDACQALGATQRGKKAGSFGNAGAFSFYPAKILGGPGDGGALVTNDKKVYDFAIEYRNHWKKDYTQWGINSRLDNVLAVELLIKLKRIQQTLARRTQIACIYKESILRTLPITLPEHVPGRVWQDYIINVGKNRNALYEFLKAEGIETMKNEYPFPMKKLKESLQYEAETLRLPINEVLTNEEVEYVIEKIHEFYSSNH